MMIRFLKIVFLFIFCFGYLNAQLINNATYYAIADSMNSMPTDSVEHLLDRYLTSDKCTRFDSARLITLKGNTNTFNGNLDKALGYYTKAIELFTPEDGYLWEVKTRLNISSIYSELKEFTNAGNQLFRVKEIIQNNKDTIYKYKVSEYFAHLFYSEGNTDSAFYYLEKITGVYESWKDTFAMSRLYNNLAVLYKDQEQFNKALLYNNKSLELSLNKSNEPAIAESYNNMGMCYEGLYNKNNKQEFLKQALFYYEEAALLKLKYTYKWNSAIANLARLNRQLGNDKIADEYYDQLEAIGQKDKAAEILDVYRNQMMHMLNTGQVGDAAYYFSLYDSIIHDMQIMQEKDFQQMLLNQRKLFHARKAEQEQHLKLHDEQEKRLIIEKKQFLTQTVFLIFAIIVVGLFYFLRQRNKYLTLKSDQENKQLKDAVLRTQMNPHFVYNALTAIQNSVLKEDQLVTASYVARFARLIRQTLNVASVDRITMEEDIKALEDYIETQKMRFGDKFSYQIETDEHLRIKDTYVPPLVLQPLVENAIHHGFKNLKRKGFIHIKIAQVGCCRVKFEVIDNGVGYHPKEKDDKDHALDILKSRLALFQSGDENTFSIEDLADGGTRVSYILTLMDHV
ncbi:tetratricopeptide repeat-containing sensor histidine kinase [Plebeiibacterium sediminum]|uniref:Histidine kinase n=1 Tax=Plebeiibacterium sediminum TaxID=2992112 RepID=A0AAE3M235_9BACT|nr:histidine kinase [Plebeiobacterium sediminum]MCW3785319.1 histidine kinase [Plebeiobacterium sediminum]